MAFVGRAGDKLDAALRAFGIAPAGAVCADFGCNVGGFTDCWLQHGAARIYAVDTGYGALDWKLRQDKRVIVMERSNAMHVTLPEAADCLSIDVGWTRLDKILPNALACLKPEGHIVALLKTHYEAERDELRGGTLLPELVETVTQRALERLRALPLQIAATTPSPLTGERGGNIEFLLHIRRA